MLEATWQSADGTTVPISQMKDSHLHNCIRKIQRDGTWRREQLDRLLLEVEIRAMGLTSGRTA